MLRRFCEYIGKYCEVRGSFHISEQKEMIEATIINKLREYHTLRTFKHTSAGLFTGMVI